MGKKWQLPPARGGLLADSVRLLRHKGYRPRYRYRDEGHRGHELFYVDFGSMSLTNDKRTFVLETGDCIIIPARMFHSIGSRGDRPFDSLHLVYTGSAPRKLTARVLHLLPEERRIMAAIKREEDFRLPEGHAMAVAKLNELLILLQRRTHPGSAPGTLLGENRLRYRDLVVQKALGYLESNVSKLLDSAAVARYCGVSPSRLRVVLKNVTGRSLRQHLRAMRVELARHLLHGSYTNIDAICYQVGYQSVPHFCTVFKSLTGMTPTDFARSLGSPTTNS
ncbi:MAG: helix-turn-helix domain-containing protein [Planctomycetes bacterium]|nr:helix-turn-helix domain-containing protein [Planctomycetota bacterium]